MRDFRGFSTEGGILMTSRCGGVVMTEGDTAGVDWWGGGQLVCNSGRAFEAAGGRRRKVGGEGGRERRGVGRY